MSNIEEKIDSVQSKLSNLKKVRDKKIQKEKARIKVEKSIIDKKHKDLAGQEKAGADEKSEQIIEGINRSLERAELILNQTIKRILEQEAERVKKEAEEKEKSEKESQEETQKEKK